MPSHSPLHLHYIKQDEETQTNFHLNPNSPFTSPSRQPRETHGKFSLGTALGPFRPGAELILTTTRIWVVTERCRFLLACSCWPNRWHGQGWPTGLCQQTDLHFFHQAGAGQWQSKARRVTLVTWFQKMLPSTWAPSLLTSLEMEKIHSLSSMVFPNLHFYLSSDTHVSLDTQGKNLPQNNSVPGNLAIIPVACPCLIYLLSWGKKYERNQQLVLSTLHPWGKTCRSE